MRPTVIAGNWKMNKDLDGSIALLKELKQIAQSIPSHVKVIVCPPFISLSAAAEILKGSGLALGGQNMFQEDEGAYTGEVSASMLKSVGCEYVILGHSERRQYFGENNDLINKKAKKALASGLIPILCVGETLEEREKNITEQVVSAQVRGVLKDLPASDVEKLIIAYEPVWAIGTGKTATSNQAEDVHRLIRKLIGQIYSWSIAEKVVVQYGGSVKPENSAELLAQPDIDGALVGGACLNSTSFLKIIQSSRVS